MYNLLGALSRGDGAVDNYTGTLLKPSSLRVRGNVLQAQTAGANVRIICFQWQDASTPAVSGLLYNIASVFGPTSPISWVNHRKIHVLWDKNFPLSYKGGTTIKSFDFMIGG
jgi:hypothetical protein